MTDVLERASDAVRASLERVLEGAELGWQEATTLLTARGRDLRALGAVADSLRSDQVGERVGYVINRNINFTNVCTKSCKFCAFSRVHRSEEAYFLSTGAIVERVQQARAFGATEVCLQAGLPPDSDGRIYIDLCRAVHEAVPDVHIHAFSPEEIKFGSERAGMTFGEYIAELRDVGLGSLPGTSAEILDDEVRRRLAGGRISTAEWIDVIRAAHRLGVPTTSTIMFGHVEAPEHVARHIDLLRSMQKDTGGFTEFVPLSFVHTEAPLYQKRMLPDVRPGPTGAEVSALFAVSRLMLGRHIANLQVSWVKEGLRSAQHLLDMGANDLGGTLMNESISTAAGASHGQRVSPRELRRVICDAGRTPVQRTTLYGALREFTAADDGPLEPLDSLEDGDAVFGSYVQLTRDARVRRAAS